MYATVTAQNNGAIPQSELHRKMP